ncbi:MAG: UDP-N-acetylglucosamine 2-epimerase (hydrolyzing) [Oscillospiraceae bacterium]|nr:UDP-N-acetylglucosamine 2-epimerase (hydrolyzing) [Oscillospiraceae bacterium]
MKKIMVVTSTRADYGLLRPVIKRIHDSEKLELCLVATGTHLLEKYGNTVEEIEKDGFPIAHRVDIMKFGFGEYETAQTIAYTIQAFSQLLMADRPDMMVVLGDRYEMFAVCTAASTLSVPLAHISGGDVTVGAKDDFYRHCMTKMANLHFPSCPDSTQRVIQLGENPATVYNVGGLGNENIHNVPLMTLEELEESLDFKNLLPFSLITYHPETQKGTKPVDEMAKMLAALDEVEDINLIFTKSNADAGGDELNRLVDEYCEKNSHRAKAFFSLGLKRYLSAMKYTSLVLGNSSSGVVETPAFGTPTVNIGDRQKGRFIAENVIQTTGETDSILAGIRTALSDEHKEICKNVTNPYYAGCIASEEIVNIITEYVYSPHNTIKIFHDIKGE